MVFVCVCVFALQQNYCKTAKVISRFH